MKIKKILSKLFFWRGFSRRNKLGTVIFVIILAGFSSLYIWNAIHPEKGEAAWWNSDWDYRVIVPITAHTSAEDSVYISLTIPDTDDLVTAGKLQADCGDFRFVDAIGNILPYYISSGCNSASTVIHIFFNNFPAGAQTIYYYYGNPSAKNGFVTTDFSTEASSYTIGTLGSEEAGPAPIGYWNFDEGYGTVTHDSTTNANNGTITAATWQTEDMCISGKCLFFDGSTARVDMGNPKTFQLTGSMTLSAWVRPTAYTSNSGIITKFFNTNGNRGYNYGITSTGVVQFRVSTDGTAVSTASTTQTIPLNQWSYIVVVYTASVGQADFYINGKLSRTVTGLPTSVFNPNRNLQVGAWDSGATGSNLFDGFIDEPRVYDYPRTASQVLSDYNSRGSTSGSGNVMGASTQAFLSNGLVGYWRMDGTSGDASDSSGSNVTLTNNNTATYTDGKFGNGGEFDSASSQYFSAGSTISGVNTVSFWVNPDSTTDNYINLTSSAYINSSSGTISATGFTNPKIYVNGVESSTLVADTWQLVTITSTTAINADTFYVGRASSSYMDGILDEIRLYDRILSPSEISQLYNWAPDPILYYNNDAGQGTSTFDSSTNGYSGTLSGGPQWTQGKYGKGLQFTQSTSQRTAVSGSSAPLNILNNNTMGFWIKFTDTAAASTYTRIAGYQITSGNDRAPAVWVCPATSSTLGLYWRFGPSNLGTSCWGPTGSGSTFNTNQWYYVAVAKLGTTATYYVNGVKYGTFTVDATMSSGNGTFYVGYNGAYQAAGMIIDEVRLYNYARTPEQIVSDMNAGNPAFGSPNGAEVGHWDFDENYGSIAHNLGNAGSAYNGALATSTMWNPNGKYNNGLNITGTSSSVSVPDGSGAFDFGSGDFSVSAWVKTSSTVDNRNLIAKGAASGLSGWRVGLSSGRLHALIGDASTDEEGFLAPSSRSIADNKWHQITVVFNRSGNAVGYIDGVPSGSVFDISPVTGSVDNSSALLMKANTFGTYAGMLDEVRIYNYALTASEVKTNYNNGQGIVMGAISDTSALSGGSVASNSASAQYCVPGDSSACDAPVARFDFEEGQGTTVNDTSGNSNTGSWNGTAPYWGQGKIGFGGNFNGTNSYVNVVDSPSIDPANAVSVSAWAYPKDSPTNEVVITKRYSLFSSPFNSYLIDTTSGKWRFCITTSLTQTCVNDPVNYPTNQWNFISGTYDGTTMRLYVNGILKASSSKSGTIDYSSVAMYIGNANTLTGNFNGRIDEVRVYDYARSQAQVDWDYNHGGPIGYWDMDDCQGSIAGDSSGLANNGTVSVGGGGTSSIGTCQTASSFWGGSSGTGQGKFNYAPTFDGTDDAISVADSPSLDIQTMTVSAWIKTSTATEQYIMERNNTTFYFATGIASGKLCYYIASVAASWLCSNRTVTDGNWHHVVGTWDGTNKRLYIDGVLDKTGAGTGGNIGNSAVGINIGVRVNVGTPLGYFTGQIDDVRLYNYPLSGSQVKQVYNQGSAVRFGPATGTP